MYGSDISRVRIAFDHDFDPFTKPGQLVSDVSRPTQTLELQKLFVTELLGVICLDPSLPNVEKGEMVPATPHKVLSGLIGMKFFVLRAIENR